MKITLLYFDGCPNWRPTLEDIRTVLKDHHVGVETELLKVTSKKQAQEMAFLGSPTVRVDGVDVEPGIPETGFGIECRLYWVEGRVLGRPPVEWIAAAVESAAG